MREIVYLLLTALVFTSCQNDKEVLITYDSELISYMGRVGMNSEGYAELLWPGSSVSVNFEGTGIKALLKDETGQNYYNIIVDNDSIILLRPDTVQQVYTLVSGLDPGQHSVQLFRRNGWDRGITYFYGFRPLKNTSLLPVEKTSGIKIEFYGNSITEGYGVDDYEQDRPDSIYTNNYHSYAAVTARHFDAEYSCIARGGIGIMVSWYPLIMPEMYNRLDPRDPASKWDFSKYTPDFVVINLFQNDSWIVHRQGDDCYKYRFGEGDPPSEEEIVSAYASFITSIRKEYPESQIICMLGNMDITREGSPWPGYVEKAVVSLEDEKLHTLFVPFKDSPGHPKIEEQQIMADSLIAFIESYIDL